MDKFCTHIKQKWPIKTPYPVYIYDLKLSIFLSVQISIIKCYYQGIKLWHMFDNIVNIFFSNGNQCTIVIF